MGANLPYVITGLIALIVTIYLIAALLFPERF
jgi:K+-transporting ATPase KdpF subunit